MGYREIAQRIFTACFFTLILLISTNLQASNNNNEHKLNKSEVGAWLKNNFAAATTILFKFSVSGTSHGDTEIHLSKDYGVVILDIGFFGEFRKGQYEITRSGSILFKIEVCERTSKDLNNCIFPEMEIYKKGGKFYMIKAIPSEESAKKVDLSRLKSSKLSVPWLFKQITK